MNYQTQIRKLFNRFGFDLVRLAPDGGAGLPPDLSGEEKQILARVRPYTMTSVERVLALIGAVRHVSASEVPGAIVECGVWRGGSAMVAMLALNSAGDHARDIYLYDTYQGMSQPGAEDVSHDGVSAAQQLRDAEPGAGVWCNASLEDVRNNVLSTGYPEAKIHFVRGDVQATIPATCPKKFRFSGSIRTGMNRRAMNSSTCSRA
jgi:O-methyltransferase